MWLMKHAHMTKPAAYDRARKEFYQVRREQEIERRIAKEEALHYGAYFGKSTLEVSEELEDEVWEKWKEKAVAHLEQLQVQRQQTVTYTSDEGEEGTLTDEIRDEPLQVDAPLTEGEMKAGLEEVGQTNIPMSKRGQEAFGGAPVRPMASPSNIG